MGKILGKDLMPVVLKLIGDQSSHVKAVLQKELGSYI